MDKFAKLPPIDQKTLLKIRLFVFIFCIYPFIAKSDGPWGISLWTGHVFMHFFFPIFLLYQIKRHATDTWTFSKEIILKKGKSWPSAFLLAFIYWIALKIIYYHAIDLFPQFFEKPLQAALTHPNNGTQRPGLAIQTVLWMYSSLTAGIVEELIYKLLLLLALPRSWGAIKFTLTATALIMLGHIEQSIGDIILKAPLFAIPTALYFYKTGNLGFLIAFHVFSDLFLLAPFIFS